MKTRYLESKGILLLSALMLLNGCAKTSSSVIPDWPLAGKPVYNELTEQCGGKDLPRCPATLEWLGRVATFKDQLDVAR